MKTFVSFESDFPCKENIEFPCGQELAQYFSDGLKKSGFQVVGPNNREDWAWDLLLNKKGYQIESIIGYVNDSSIQWLITTYLHLPFWKNIPFLNTKNDQSTNDLQNFCKVIDELLSNNHFSKVRWYDQESFDKSSVVTK